MLSLLVNIVCQSFGSKVKIWLFRNNILIQSIVQQDRIYYARCLSNFRYSNFEAAIMLVSAFVMNHTDLLKSLLATVPVNYTDQLQRVLNSAARLLLSVLKFNWELCTEVLDQLQWLQYSTNCVALSLRCYMVCRRVHSLSCEIQFWPMPIVITFSWLTKMSW